MISIIGGSAPATLGFSAFGPEWPYCGATFVAPAVPAAEPALGSHPCVALSSARVFPAWTQSRLAINVFPANGDYPLNFVSQKSAQCRRLRPFPSALTRVEKAWEAVAGRRGGDT